MSSNQIPDIRKYHIIYKITNKLNGKYYIGAHSTDNLDDGYLGSGILINQAIKKNGKENFIKEILSYHETRFDMFLEEKRVVNEHDEMSYNLVGGGGTAIISGERHHFYGKKRPDSSKLMKENNPSSLEHVKKMLKTTATGTCLVDGITSRYDINDPRWKTGEIVSINKGKITAKDKDGNVFHTTKDDPRWKTGEIVHNTTGIKRSKESIEKWHKSMEVHKGKRRSKESIKKRIESSQKLKPCKYCGDVMRGVQLGSHAKVCIIKNGDVK